MSINKVYKKEKFYREPNLNFSNVFNLMQEIWKN